MIPKNIPSIFIATLWLSLSLAAAGETLPLINGGFEEELTGWTVSEVPGATCTVRADAAHQGKAGLHVVDESDTLSAKALSTPIPVNPGTTYRLSFWANTPTPGRMGVFMRFETANHQIIDPENLTHSTLNGAASDWVEYSVEARAPEEASSLTIWVHSYSRMTGSADLDDFALESVDAAGDSSTPAAAASPAPIKATALSASTTPSRDSAHPMNIILKLDDFRAAKDHRALPAQWQKLAALIKERQLKVSIGIVCDSLAEGNDASLAWVRDLQKTGLVEFWFHGYDHQGWLDTDGRAYAEFRKRPYEEQKRRFEQSQQLAEQKLGFPFQTFGPPGFVPPKPPDGESPVLTTPQAPAFPGDNFGFDASTIQVMQEDPHMKVWLYPTPIDEAGRQLAAKGKVAILDRVWNVNIEMPLFTPNLSKLKEGYSQAAPKRNYLVLQGHPTHWDDAKFAEFVKIVDFLTREGAVFTTPSEYRNTLSGDLAKSSISADHQP